MSTWLRPIEEYSDKGGEWWVIIAEQIANYLNDQGIALYEDSSDSGIYIDILPEKNQVFAIYNQTGQYSESDLGYRRVGIQIIYRGNDNPLSSYETADLAYKALQGFSGDLENYIVSCLSRSGGPVRMGTDNQGNYEYTMNFIIEYKEA